MARLEGDFSVMSLSDLSIWAANRRFTGTLQVQLGTTTKMFQIESGAAVRASSNDPREYFGQFLLHYGLITEDQLERAFRTQNETDVLLGRILTMIGIVSEEQIVRMLRVKICESLLDAFRWAQGRFLLEDHPASFDRAEIEVAVPLLDIQREAKNRQAMWSDFSLLFPDAKHVLDLNEALLPESAQQPDTLDGRIVSLARHGLSIEAIGLELHATDYQVASRLLELHRSGALRPREPSISAPTPDPTSPESYISLAKKAVAAGQYARAWSYVEVGAKLDPMNPIFAALKQEIAEQTAAKSDGLQERVPFLVRAPGKEDLRRLSAKQRYVLARIDGKRSVGAIIQVSPMHDIEALEVIRQLEVDGLIAIGAAIASAEAP